MRAVELMRKLLERYPGMRCSGKRTKKGATAEAAWQSIRRDSVDAYDWYAIQPSSVGLFLVDVDSVYEHGGYRKPVQSEVEALARALSGGKGEAYVYESTEGSRRWHIWFADPQQGGGRQWNDSTVPYAPRTGFSSQNGLFYALPDTDSLLKFDTRGGGEYRDMEAKSGPVGCHIVVDAARLQHMWNALESEDLAEVSNPRVLGEAYLAGVEADSNPQGPKRGLHKHLEKQTQLIYDLSDEYDSDDYDMSLDKLEARIWQEMQDGEWAESKDRDRATLRQEIRSLFYGWAEKQDLRKRKSEAKILEGVEAANEYFATYTKSSLQFIDFDAWGRSDQTFPPLLTKEATSARMAELGINLGAKAFAEHRGHRGYWDMQFAGENEELASGILPIRIFVPRTRGVLPKGKLLEEYVDEKLCDGNKDEREWVLDFFADLVQNPSIPGPGTALVLTGFPGSGKTAVYDLILRPVLGDRLCVKVTGLESLVDKNNETLAGKPLVFGDEMVWGRHVQAAQLLKGWITDKTRLVEQKYRARQTVRNVNRLIATTNHDIAGFIEPSDRRWTVIRTPSRFTPEEIADGAHREAFAEYWKGFPQQVPETREYLFRRKVDRERLSTPVATEAKLETIMATHPMLEILLHAVTTNTLPNDVGGNGKVARGDLAMMLSGMGNQTRPGEVNGKVQELLGPPGNGVWYAKARNCGAKGTQHGLKFESPAKLAEALKQHLPEGLCPDVKDTVWHKCEEEQQKAWRELGVKSTSVSF